MSEAHVKLRMDGPVAVISYDRPEKHNAFSDEMDARLFEILRELHQVPGLRAVVWRGEGKSFSSGRDLQQLGVRKEDLSDLEYIERGHRGSRQLMTLPCPVLVALKGWVIGGSFERALLCDIRVAGESAKMRLPEIGHGVLPDCGGTARLFQIAGHGVAADLALTGRTLMAQEAFAHGIVSRVVPDAELDETVLEMARAIAAAPEFTVRTFLRALRGMANPLVERTMGEEAVAQAMVFGSADYAELRAARGEEREPRFRGR